MLGVGAKTRKVRNLINAEIATLRQGVMGWNSAVGDGQLKHSRRRSPDCEVLAGAGSRSWFGRLGERSELCGGGV